jgi:multiple sugar transport system permease protein
MADTVMARSRRSTVLVYAALIVASAAMFAPYVLEVLTSLKSYEETLLIPPTIVPAVPQWSNYISVSYKDFPIATQLLNSAIVGAARIAGQLLFASMAAYAFARLSFPFKRTLFAIFLSVLMVPGQLFLIPQYQIMQTLGWLDTLQALFVPGMFSAFGVFLLRQFFMGLPKELDEAARIDGANPLQIYFYILLPLVRPALVALALLTLVSSWNDLLWPLIVNSTPERLPISVGLANLQGQYVTQYELIMAGAVIASAPIIVLFLIMQRQFIAGFATSGIK